MTTEQVLRQWCDNEFREALLDDGRVLRAAAIFKVAIESTHGDAIQALRDAIGIFVIDLIEPEILLDNRRN